MRHFEQSSSQYSMSKSKSFCYTNSSNASGSVSACSSASRPPVWARNPVAANFELRKSQSVSEVVETERGFKPSDIGDPSKRQFLNDLTQRVFKLGKDEHVVSRKPINLEKIFTPAEDAPQITPKSIGKMYASSAFYSPGLHPTVEDQVELARRISSSLSDASNRSSKGQSMYVNRKKRSVKWVHESEGEGGNLNGSISESSNESKSILKLVMNPCGQVQDINSLRKQGYNIESALSPDVCAEIVKDLNSPKGKGAELFAKRRKRSEKWVVGEGNPKQEILTDIAPSPTPILQTLPPLNPSNMPAPGYLPETTHRIQHKEKLDEIQERFIQPKLKLVKSPWEAALETGSVDSAFENLAQPAFPTRGNFVAPAVNSYEEAIKSDSLASWTGAQNGHGDAKGYAHNPAYNSNSINRIVDNLQKGLSNVDVYKPNLPQAWNAKPVLKTQQYSPPQPPQRTSQPKTAPLTPTYKPTAAPPVFVPKESNAPLPNLYGPSYTHQPKENIPPPVQPIYNQAYNQAPKLDYNNLQNYNTAPRGWGQVKDVYKPITFDKPKSPYSDF